MNDELEEMAREALLGGQQERSSLSGFKNPDTYDQERLEAEFASKHNFVPLKTDELPSKGYFYPENTQILIKSANVQEVKHFSSINDDDFFDIQDKMSMLFNTCVKISNGGKPVNYRDLSEFDKIFTFFAVRERTFEIDGRQSSITQKSPCQHCGEEIVTEIEKGNLGYYDIPDNIMKYYNDASRSFVMSHNKFESDLEVFIPTIGTTEKIFQFIKESEMKKQRGESGYYDLTNLTIIMYITKDWREIDDEGKYIKRKLKEIEKWSPGKYQVAVHITRKLKVGVDPTIEVHCPKCMKMSKMNIRFPDWSSLFFDEDFIGEFFGDDTPSDI